MISIENVLRYQPDTKERNEAFIDFCESLKSEKLQNAVQFITDNGMYPFESKKYEETIKEANIIFADKERMSLLLKNTKFCSRNANGCKCNFAHTLKE